MTSLAAYVLSLILSAFPPGKHPEVETREAGAARLEVAARAEADSAILFGDRWPEGPKDLARAGTAKFGWSMGFRRDVQTGDKRGPAGEVCFADLQPATLRQFAQFETAGRSDAELGMLVVGLDYDSLRRCFDTGFAALVHDRRVAASRCRSWPVEMATFALYASGKHCASPGRHWIETNPYRTLLKFRARGGTFFPDWYQPEAEPLS